MQPILVFPATDLDTSGRAFDVVLTPAWLAEELADAEASAIEPGRVAGRLSLSGTSDVVVRGEARASIHVPCARCLDPARIDLVGEVSLLLRPGKVALDPIAPPAAQSAAQRSSGKRRPRAEPEALRGGSKKSDPGGPRGKARPKSGEEDEYEFSADEADHDLYDGETIVLDPFVREALLLEIPNFPLCSDDCAGIRAAPEDPSERAEAAADKAPAPRPGVKSLGDALRAAMVRPSDDEGGSRAGVAKSPPKKKRTR